LLFFVFGLGFIPFNFQTNNQMNATRKLLNL
jgi:hypothetical protein